MFVNYFAQQYRNSPINLFVARVVLGIYGIWKTLSYDFGKLQQWPQFIFEQGKHAVFLPSMEYLSFLPIIQWLIVLLLVLFILGYRLRIVSIVSALLILHTTALHYMTTNSTPTFLPFVYILILFALFAETNKIKLKKLKVFKNPLQTLKKQIRNKHNQQTNFIILKLTLLIVAATYFLTGFAKIYTSGPAWISAKNFITTVHSEVYMHIGGFSPLTEILIKSELFATLSAILTIVLEVGMIFIILLKLKKIFPLFIIGLLGMHTMILLSMNIFFFDQYILFALFIPWDKMPELKKYLLNGNPYNFIRKLFLPRKPI